ncbi:MAG: TlpA disulfide reductase family protein [Limisphaerales bacterium]
MIHKLVLLACLTAFTAFGDEALPLLTIKGQTYSNVTVTTVTATDIFFKHASGMGNAKLKDLDPKLQTHFHYDAAVGKQLEKQQITNNILYHEFLLTNKPVSGTGASQGSSEDDFVAPKLSARSVLGHSPPVFAVEKWLTPKPDATGKSVMIVFWSTSSDFSRRTIPLLNTFYEKFNKRLVIIGITAEPEAEVRKMTNPRIEFASAIDTQAIMAQALEITAVPHCILVDPHAIVRYEGLPQYLDEQKLDHFLTKYQ